MSRIWAIDAGNTRLKAAYFDGEILRGTISFSREELLHHRHRVFTAAEKAAAELGSAADGCVVACGRAAEEPIVAELARIISGGRTPLALSTKGPLPYNLEYEGIPGPDRLANAVALRMLAPAQNAIAVDFGTATNIVVVDMEGNFRGGAILAGSTLQERALVEATRGRLPHVSLAEDAESIALPATSTTGAIRAGIIIGHAGAIDRLIEETRRTLADAEAPVITTGGNAPQILPHLRTPHTHEENLTLLGLREYWSFAAKMREAVG